MDHHNQTDGEVKEGDEKVCQREQVPVDTAGEESKQQIIWREHTVKHHR